MKYTILTLTIVTILSCRAPSDKSQPFKVEYKGAMKNVMIKGDISSQVHLINLQSIKHLYALGPVENLKGEILIFDGTPFISSVQDNVLDISNSFDHKATLLVYTNVDTWNSFGIPEDIATYGELESRIEEIAKEKGINTDKPFPFLINGVAKSVDWHVIDWKEGDREHTHQKHKQSGLHGTIKNKEIDILGFYSKNHHGIFTHHDSNMHLHIKTADNRISGHLDDLTLGARHDAQATRHKMKGKRANIAPC